MEFVWMIPLYIVIPVIGILFVINGIKAKKGERRKRILIGLFFFSLPFLHSFIIKRIDISLEKSLIGNYKLDNQKSVLKLNPNKTFELAKIDSVPNYGTGNWKLIRWDIDEVELTFKDSNKISFEVVNSDSVTYLQNSFLFDKEYKSVKLFSVKHTN